MRRLIFLLFCTFLSCEYDNSINPELLIPSSEELQDKFSFEFISEDSIEIIMQETLISDTFFEKAIIGYEDENIQFVQTDTIPFQYVKRDNDYLMRLYTKFKISGLIDQYYNDLIKIQLRLYLNDLDFRTVFLNVYPHKYIYESAEIEFKIINVRDDIEYGNYVQDFSVNGKDIFCLIYNGYDIYKYSKVNKKAHYVSNTEHQDCFTYHDDFLYMPKVLLDMPTFNQAVAKININTAEITAWIGTGDIGDDYIGGLVIYEEKLYILHYIDIKSPHISIYDLNGKKIGGTAINLQGDGFAIHDDIIFTVYRDRTKDPSQWEIQRVGIKKLKKLPSLNAPSSDIYEVEIKNGRLYYNKWYTGTIYSVPLSVLKEVPIAPNKAM